MVNSRVEQPWLMPLTESRWNSESIISTCVDSTKKKEFSVVRLDAVCLTSANWCCVRRLTHCTSCAYLVCLSKKIMIGLFFHMLQVKLKMFLLNYCWIRSVHYVQSVNSMHWSLDPISSRKLLTWVVLTTKNIHTYHTKHLIHS